jgi:hypothetical protein
VIVQNGRANEPAEVARLKMGGRRTPPPAFPNRQLVSEPPHRKLFGAIVPRGTPTATEGNRGRSAATVVSMPIPFGRVNTRPYGLVAPPNFWSFITICPEIMPIAPSPEQIALGVKIRPLEETLQDAVAFHQRHQYRPF